MDQQTLASALSDINLGGLRFLKETGSTNDDALAWAENGAADLSLVVADAQNAGRGRFQRRWVTPPGSALAFSLILRPTAAETGHVPLFCPLGALAVVDALDTLGIAAEIKWPNDVLVQRRKTCGILSEAVWLGSQLEAIVLGIGVNVRPTSIPPAGDALFPATCVDEHTSRPVDRAALLAAIVQAIITRRHLVGSTQFIQEWQNRLAFLGEPVRLVQHEGSIFATLLGLDSDGSLRAEDTQGHVLHMAVGEISLRPVN